MLTTTEKLDALVALHGPAVVACSCVVFRTGEAHNWPRPHARIGGLCGVDPSRPVRRRPWWWWLAASIGAAWVIGGLWTIYRAAAGHPILGGLHW